jgi:hypothetical protein
VFVAERMAVVAIWMTLQVRKFTLLGWFVFHERMKFRTQAGKMDRMLTPQEWGARSLFLMRTVGWIQNHFFWIRGFHLCEGAVALFYRIETDYYPRSIKISLECSLKKQGKKCHWWGANTSNLDPFLQVGKRSSKISRVAFACGFGANEISLWSYLHGVVANCTGWSMHSMMLASELEMASLPLPTRGECTNIRHVKP